MKIFLSALTITDAKNFVENGLTDMKWNLLSYFQFRKKVEEFEYIRDHSEEILIDSGAHSFQKGKQVDWLKYTEEYAEFIKKYDCPKVKGYFEMDVDNIIGYDKVLKLRKILENVSDKIIPVWHKNRGIDDFKKMCQNNAGKIVAITGFRNEDIRDEQYLMFLKYAKKYNCKVHCLGMTRSKVLDKVPFDYTDSSSWKQLSVYGNAIGFKKKVSKDFSKTNRYDVLLHNYKESMKKQDYYHNLWRLINKD